MGSIKLATKGDDSCTCVLVSPAFPSWLLVLQELKVTPSLVVLATSWYLSLVEALVPTSCRIFVGTLTNAPFTVGSPDKKAIGLIDGGLTTLISAWFEGLGIRTIFPTRQQQQRIAGWNNTSIALRHESLGGVTLGRAWIGAAFQDNTPKPGPVPDIAPRDASTVLLVKGEAHYFRRAPSSRHTRDFECAMWALLSIRYIMEGVGCQLACIAKHEF
jgi:hypothetical protein